MKKCCHKEQGVALVVTIIVVAMLAVIGVALMQSVSADRASSRSVTNYMKARLAAEAGLGFASALLATNMTNDDGFIVVANTNNQLFIGTNQSGAEFSYIPLFSTVSSVTDQVGRINSTNMPVATNIAAGTNFTLTNLPGGMSATSPSTISWVYLTNTNSQTNARFAFWVEDLAGKLDLSVAGTNITDSAARRPTGTNPAELALWALFSNTLSAVSSGSGGTAANDLVAARSAILTPATARLVSTNVTADILADLAVNLRYDVNEPEIIPYGFGYKDQGKAKYNINTNLSASSIVSLITNNLPSFAANRGGGMSSTNYLNYLAANIVDYADTDSVPTTIGGQAGNEPMTWLNEIFDRGIWGGGAPAPVPDVVLGADNNYYINIAIITYMEFWNMTDKTATGNLIIEIDETGQSAKVNGRDEPIASSPWTFTTNVSLSSNSYEVLAMTNVINNILWGPTPPPANATLPMNVANVKYNLSWNGVTIDTAPGGLQRTEAAAGIRRGGTNHWRGNAFVTDANRPEGRIGDPRINRFINLFRYAHSYTNRTSWGGRNYAPALTATLNEVKNWSDGTYITNSPRGITATNITKLPTELAGEATKYTNAPSRINNSGAYTNIVELGNIFDPVQWRVDLTSDSAEISSSATASADSGGGNTLRIGRAEHSRFTNDGRRASQLLDIFTATPVGGGQSLAGRVNINTASTNVLRALAAGVFHVTDPALRSAQTNGTNFVIPIDAVNAFVTGVRNFRTNKPFFSPSQLSMITNTNSATWPSNAVFGSKSVANISEWSDSAAEEWFSRIYPLTTTRSRNFLVYAVGQALNPNDPSQPISTVRMAFQVYLEPQRGGAPDYPVIRVTPRIIQTWNF